MSTSWQTELRAVAREMRDRRVNGKNQSPTLVAWANRIEQALDHPESLAEAGARGVIKALALVKAAQALADAASGFSVSGVYFAEFKDNAKLLRDAFDALDPYLAYLECKA